MLKKLVLCTLFFGFSPLLLVFSWFVFTASHEGKVLGKTAPLASSSYLFAALPDDTGVIAPQIKGENSIPIIVEDYLRHYQSPLFPFTEVILSAAEKYQMSPLLIVAIAQQESNLGKKSPSDCYNAWGWGIHARGTTCFKDWPEAIEAVTRGIARDYCAKGYCDDPCLMMKKYTPGSGGSWCAGVKQFLEEMSTGKY